MMMHDEIKTYELNNQSGEKIDFTVKTIEYIYDKANGIADKPHRHEYFTIILIDDAEGVHYIDFKEYELKRSSIHFVYPGQVHQFLTHTRPKGWVLNFSNSFLMLNNISPELFERVYLFNSFGDSPPLNLSPAEYQSLVEILKQIETYNLKTLFYKYEALGALLKLFIINISGFCCIQKDINVESDTGNNHLFKKLKSEIEANYKTEHKVGFYADVLAVSPDYLNKYIKAQTGKSAKEYISDRLIVEAKRLLLFTDSSLKELAYSLGFEEPAHFSNFFKKETNYTPGIFRQSVRENQNSIQSS